MLLSANPLERGLLDGTILAYEMNLAPLTSEHGYPVRAIVPGLYGMMNPKWITEIEVVGNVYEGYWQRNGWTNVATEDTHSSIVILVSYHELSWHVLHRFSLLLRSQAKCRVVKVVPRIT
jgi:hypothetical protein